MKFGSRLPTNFFLGNSGIFVLIGMSFRTADWNVKIEE